MNERWIWFDGPPVTFMSVETIEYLPRWIQREAGPIRAIRACEPVESLVAFCRAKKPGTVLLHRTYALGDILMLLPLARALRRVCGLTRRILIAVDRRYYPGLSGVNRVDQEIAFVEARGIVDYGADVHMDLNGVLEVDHAGGEASDHHRVHLYARAMGLAAAA